MKPRLILALTLTFVISCASLPAHPITLPQIPEVVATFDGTVTQAIDRSLTILEQAVTKEEQAASAYLLVSGLVPPSLDATIRRGFVRVSDLILAAVKRLRQGVQGWQDIRALLQPIVTAVNLLTGQLNSVSGPPAAPSNSWRPLVGELVTIVTKAALAKAGVR